MIDGARSRAIVVRPPTFQRLYGTYAPVSHDWRNKADGTPTKLDSGHQNADALGAQVAPAFWLRAASAAAQHRVVSGKLTNTASGLQGASGHIPTMIGRGVTRIGALFVFQPGYWADGTTAAQVVAAGNIGLGGGLIGAQGTLALPVWDGVPAYNQGSSPVSSVMQISGSSHLEVTRWSWTLTKYYQGHAPVMATGNFATPLKADGSTPLSVDVQINYASNTTILTLPDGSVQTVVDTGFGYPPISYYGANCHIADWETYQNDTTNDDRVAFLKIYAS